MAGAETWPDVAGRFTPEGHVLPVRIYFEDTDFSGVVYHANYLRYLERGRSDFLRCLDIHSRQFTAEGLAFAVRRMELDFLRAATIDDLLEVVTYRGDLTGARAVLRQTVRRGAEIIMEAMVTVALVDRAGRPRRFPEWLRERLLAAGAEAPGNLSLTMRAEE